MTLPEGIGPHEGLEFDLMRAGRKAVALFYELEPEGLAEISADPSFSCLRFSAVQKRGISVPVWIVFHKNAEVQAKQLKALVQQPPNGWKTAHEREVGRILGYNEADIDAFIAHVGAT
jgi:hypothetical protein